MDPIYQEALDSLYAFRCVEVFAGQRLKSEWAEDLADHLGKVLGIVIAKTYASEEAYTEETLFMIKENLHA